MNLASDPVKFPVKIFYRRGVAFLKFVEQKSETWVATILLVKLHLFWSLHFFKIPLLPALSFEFQISIPFSKIFLV